MADVVNDRKDMHQITSNNIENAVGESGQQGTSNTGKDFCIKHRNLLQPFQLKFKCQLKLGAQPRALCLVPLVCLANLSGRTGRELQAVRHDPFFSCALT